MANGKHVDASLLRRTLGGLLLVGGLTLVAIDVLFTVTGNPKAAPFHDILMFPFYFAVIAIATAGEFRVAMWLSLILLAVVAGYLRRIARTVDALAAADSEREVE